MQSKVTRRGFITKISDLSLQFSQKCQARDIGAPRLGDESKDLIYAFRYIQELGLGQRTVRCDFLMSLTYVT